LSIDGPKEIHDQYRVTKGGKPTFERVFHTAKLFQPWVQAAASERPAPAGKPGFSSGRDA